MAAHHRPLSVTCGPLECKLWTFFQEGGSSEPTEPPLRTGLCKEIAYQPSMMP